MSGFRQNKALYHPRYWLVWLGFGLLRGITFLPFNIIMSLGKLLGRVLFRLAKRRVNIARINLKLCFPELSDSELEILLRSYFESAGMSLMDMAIAWWWSDKRFFPRVNVSGLKHLEEAFASGKGVLLYTGHFSCIEISGRILSRHVPSLMVMYRPNENPVVQHILIKNRTHHTSGIISRDNVREMLKALKDGKGVWFAPDQNYGHKNSVFSDFFSVPAATNTSSSRFVEKTGALVVPFAAYRDKDGYQLEIAPVMKDFPGESVKEDADRLNLILENFIRKHPEQYNWMHRRFKDRPNNEPRFY